VGAHAGTEDSGPGRRPSDGLPAPRNEKGQPRDDQPFPSYPRLVSGPGNSIRLLRPLRLRRAVALVEQPAPCRNQPLVGVFGAPYRRSVVPIVKNEARRQCWRRGESADHIARHRLYPAEEQRSGEDAEPGQRAVVHPLMAAPGQRPIGSPATGRGTERRLAPRRHRGSCHGLGEVIGHRRPQSPRRGAIPHDDG
jgi:hypothetical protein